MMDSDKSKGSGCKVDAETRNELLQLEIKLTGTITEKIADGFKELQVSIEKFFNKDIDYLKEENKRWAKYHQEHYEAERRLENEIYAAKKEVSKDVDTRISAVTVRLEDLEKRQTTDEGVATGTEKATEGAIRKAELSYTKIGLILSALVALGGLMGWIIGRGAL